MKKIFLSILLLLASVGLQQAPVQAALFDGSSQVACEGIQLDESSPANCSEEPTKVNNALELAVNLFSLVVGVTAVIMLIIGGLKYVTSTGDGGSVASAKNTIIYAVVGLVVVVLAQSIVRFTVNRTATTPGQEAAADREASGETTGDQRTGPR